MARQVSCERSCDMHHAGGHNLRLPTSNSARRTVGIALVLGGRVPLCAAAVGQLAVAPGRACRHMREGVCWLGTCKTPGSQCKPPVSV